jgi:hypothetical protein
MMNRRENSLCIFFSKKTENAMMINIIHRALCVAYSVFPKQIVPKLFFPLMRNIYIHYCVLPSLFYFFLILSDLTLSGRYLIYIMHYIIFNWKYSQIRNTKKNTYCKEHSKVEIGNP